jgi:hypothetical protein
MDAKIALKSFAKSRLVMNSLQAASVSMHAAQKWGHSPLR